MILIELAGKLHHIFSIVALLTLTQLRKRHWVAGWEPND
jgi:hypothetical protein